MTDIIVFDIFAENIQRKNMDVLNIPFVEKVGITKSADDRLELAFSSGVQNHVQTLHASAQFTLAETASGEALQREFPKLVGKVIPILRDSEIKFKKPALKNVYAEAVVSDESHIKFSEQFSRKGRASIQVSVQVKDVDGTVTCIGTFNWFVQKIES